MAQPYTPGLTIAKHCVIERTRVLPIKGEVLVQKGEKVSAEQVVARAFLPGPVTVINVAQKLGITAEDLPQAMRVREKEKVHEGQVIASVKSFFGLFNNEIRSPVSGEIESVSFRTGQVMIRHKPTALQLSAYIDGEVAEVFPQEGVKIRTEGSWIQGIFGVGGEKRGVLRVAVSDRNAELRPEEIGPEVKGAVLVGGAFATAEAYNRASEYGACALIVGGFDASDLKAVLGYDLGVAITGEEDLSTTLILTEGFGRISMARTTFELLKKFEGQAASVNGATQIRAGVVRPEIVISRPTLQKEARSFAPEKAPELCLGSTVRVIREPFFGKVGKVVSMPAELRRVETGALVRVLEVELEDGGKVTVPRANVELLAEWQL